MTLLISRQVIPVKKAYSVTAVFSKVKTSIGEENIPKLTLHICYVYKRLETFHSEVYFDIRSDTLNLVFLMPVTESSSISIPLTAEDAKQILRVAITISCNYIHSS